MAQDKAPTKTKYSQKQLDSIKIDSLEDYVWDQFYRRNYETAIEVGQSTRVLAKKHDEIGSYFNISSVLGNSFLYVEDTLQAKTIFEESVLEAKKYGNTKYIITTQIDLGNLYGMQKKREQAFQVFEKTLPLAEKLQDTARIFILNYNLGEISIDLENPKDAEKYVGRAQDYINIMDTPAYLAVVGTYAAATNILQGRLELLKNNNQAAIGFLKMGIEGAEKVGYIDAVITGYEQQAEAEAGLGNFESAFNLHVKLDSIKDEKYKTDKIEAIESATAKYKLNEYQKEIEAQKIESDLRAREAERESTILWAIIVGITLIATIIILIIYNSKIKKLVKDLRVKNELYLQQRKDIEQLSESRTKLFSNISHELRTPLYGIIGITSILIDDKELNKHEEDIKSLKFSADYLLSLINNVLQLNQLDSVKKEDLEKRPFEVKQISKSIIKSIEYLNQNNNKFKLKVDPEIPKTIKGDKVKVSQILINLLGNAVKFTENGVITLAIEKVSETLKLVELKFTITDTGAGISEEQQKELYNEFGRISFGEKYQGTGLGLPIVKRILDMHNSEITLKSKLGEGTQISFSIFFEKTEQDKSSSNVIKAASNTNNQMAEKVVLIADDNKINQKVTERNLQKIGVKVLIANNGIEAIEIATKHDVDLILMDINMPDMNGIEATKEIKKFKPYIPVIALTAVEPYKIKERNDFEILDDVIVKPYQIEAFIEKITLNISGKQEFTQN